jgi:hypothetical protein
VNVTASDMDAAIAADLRRALAGVDDLRRRYDVAAHRLAEPQGRASADHACHPDGRFVSIFASQALSSALDHLAAWRKLVDAGYIPIHAHMTLLRAALEGSVLCRWLVEAKVHPETRVARGFAARRDDQDERSKFETSREGGARASQRTSGMSAVQRLELLDDREAVDAREAAGIRSVGFPDTTSLMMKFGLERLFRLLSAAAHAGKEWGLAASKLERSDAAMPPGVSAGVVSAEDEVVLALTRLTINAVIRAVVAFEVYSAAPAGRPRPSGVPSRAAAEGPEL